MPAPRPTAGGRGAALLAAHPTTCDAVANLLGCKETWETAAPAGAALPGRYPTTATALEALLAHT